MSFYVWSDKLRRFVLTPEHKVRCPECGASSEDMTLDELPTNRGEWLLQCECGEQFFNTND
jgi:hypothetical protein